MGKRLKVRKPQVPKLRVGRLRDPQELSLKIFGLLIPVGVYGFLLAVAHQFMAKGFPYLVAWFVLGLMAIVAMPAAQKRKLAKTYPHSKVTGSQFQEVRLKMNQFRLLLDMKKVPEAFIIQSNQVAATVRGLTGPYLVLSSRLQELLPPAEFEVMLATLMGHVKAGNVKWRTFITTVRQANPLFKILMAPYLPVAAMLTKLLDLSHRSADKLGLLLTTCDTNLFSRTILKVMAYTSAEITPDQIQRLDAFLSRQGIQAAAQDVENTMLLGIMQRQIPGLQERLGNIVQAPSDARFQEQLEVMRQRKEAYLSDAR